MIELKKNKYYQIILRQFISTENITLSKIRVRKVELQRRFWFFGWRWRTIKTINSESGNISYNNSEITIMF